MVVEISFVLCRLIVCEVEKIGGLALSVRFRIGLSSVIELRHFYWRMVVGQELGWDGRNGEGRVRKAEFRPTLIYWWVSRQSVVMSLGMSVELELRMTIKWKESVHSAQVDENVASSFLTGTARFVVSLRPRSCFHRPQWKRNRLGVRR